MLRAEWFSAAAMDWLSSATSMRRVWIAGLSAAEISPGREDEHGERPDPLRRQREQDLHEGERDETAEQRPLEVAVGEDAADEVADRHAEAHDHEHDRHDPLRRAGDLGDHRRDVAVDGEESAEPDRADRERQPHLPMRKTPQLGTEGAAGVARVLGHEEGDADGRGGEDRRDDDEGRSPARPAGRGTCRAARPRRSRS